MKFAQPLKTKILRFGVALLPIISFGVEAYAAEPSVTVQKMLELNRKITSESAAKQAIQENKEKITAYLNKQPEQFTLCYRDGAPTNFFEGQILEKTAEFKDIEFLFDYMTVELNKSDKIIIPAKGRAYFVRIPMVLRETYCLIKDGKVLIKYIPQLSSVACTKKKNESVSLCDKFNIAFSAVAANNFIFYLGEDGNLYR